MIQRWYLNRLLDKLDALETKLARHQEWFDSTVFSEYTEGWLGHLERRVEDLIVARANLKARINRWM